LFALTETWTHPFTISAELSNSDPNGFPLFVFLIQLVLIIKTKLLLEVMLFLLMILAMFSPVLPLFSNHFEISIVSFKLFKIRLTAFNFYRPLPSSTKAVPFSQFLIDFQNFVSLAATTYHEFLITAW
jgi:hypothetical protein